MLVKHISFVLALLFAIAIVVGASPTPSKRAPAPFGKPSKRAPAPYPAPSKRAPAPYPAPSKRAPMPAPSKRAPAPAPSKRAPAPAPSQAKRAFAPEPVMQTSTESSALSEPGSSILICQELNRPSDTTTSEFLNIFDIVLSEVESSMWVGLNCERVVDGDLVKRGLPNIVRCARSTEDGLIATGCTRF